MVFLHKSLSSDLVNVDHPKYGSIHNIHKTSGSLESP